MRKLLRLLKRVWILNFIRRIYFASRYFNYKYLQILRWGFKSKEDTNYTYNLKPENILYLASTISAITGTDIESILAYINEAEQDEHLKNHIITYTKTSSFKNIVDMEVRFGRRLGWYAIARIIKPKVIVETGVDKGLGAVLLCSALLRNKEEGFDGKYYGTEINPHAGYLLDGIYKEAGEILYGDSIESLSKMNANIDLFINDSDHSADYEYREYQTIKNKITDNSIILGDNSHCSDKLAVFSKENGRNFLYFNEAPLKHWYPGAGIGISYKR